MGGGDPRNQKVQEDANASKNLVFETSLGMEVITFKF
jgi:hypothetical protein